MHWNDFRVRHGAACLHARIGTWLAACLLSAVAAWAGTMWFEQSRLYRGAA